MTSAPASPTARNAYIDTLRGWSIFGVVCIHFAGSFATTDTFAWSPSFWLGLTLNQVFIFAVPLFVFLSGLLAGMSRKPQTLGEYYRGRVRRIVYPYLIVSVLSFFFLNHYAEWKAVAGNSGKLLWLLQRVGYTGVEPTLYFIPLIILLYLLQPALKALPSWLSRVAPGISADRWALLTSAVLLVAHLGLGLACFQGRLNYYVWGRPDPLFWVFYFFTGLHFRSIVAGVPEQALRLAWKVGLLIALAAMTWNFIHHSDQSVVGEHFERNNLDYAYVRPEILVYDLAVVLLFAAGLQLGWNPRATVVSWLGQYTLEIYLWHILVLYYGAWRYADTLAACRQLPELMVIICATAPLFIAGVYEGWEQLKDYVRHHRLTLISDP
jgi:surface polysaccharide O-acyltransferase-like enzyme